MCSLEKEEERLNKMLQYQQNLGISQTPPYFLAIGIGFGVQNLINNFISGFIIMLERPIKIGDMIEMKNSFETIEGIGARCTCIRIPAMFIFWYPTAVFWKKYYQLDVVGSKGTRKCFSGCCLWFRIEQLFKTAGIVIAFPQQDTHLYTSRPHELRMLKIDEEKS